MGTEFKYISKDFDAWDISGRLRVEAEQAYQLKRIADALEKMLR